MSTFRINSIIRAVNVRRFNSSKLNFISPAFYHTENGVYGAPNRAKIPIDSKNFQ